MKFQEISNDLNIETTKNDIKTHECIHDWMDLLNTIKVLGIQNRGDILPRSDFLYDQ